MAVRLEVSAHRAIAENGRRSSQEAADELGGEVLRLGGAAAVADGEQPAAAGEHRRQLPAPGLDQLGPGGQGAHAVVQLRRVLGAASGRSGVGRSRARRALPASGRRLPAGPGVATQARLARLGRGGDTRTSRSAPAAPAAAPPRPPCGQRGVGEEPGAARRPPRPGRAAAPAAPGDAVVDRVEQPADGAADDRDAAGHGLQRHDAERLVPRGGRGRRRPSGRARGIARAAPGRPAGPGRRRPAPRASPSSRRASGSRPSSSLGGPPATTSSTPGSCGQRPDHGVERPCARPAGRRRAAAAGVPTARAGRARGEVRRGRPRTGTTVSRSAGAPIARQLAHLVGAGGDDQVGVRRRGARSQSRRSGGLVSAAPWCRRLTVPSAWKVCTTGTPGAGRSPAARPGRTSRSGRARRPGVRCAGPVPRQSSRPNRAISGQQLVLGHRPRRPGGDVDDRRPRRRAARVGQVRPVPPGVDLDLVPAAAERPGERRDVHVLAAGVHAAEDGERAGVLGHHGDPHRVTSFQEPVPVVQEPLEPVARQRVLPGAPGRVLGASSGSSSHRRAVARSASTSRSTSPAAGGTASGASVVDSARTGRPQVIASSSGEAEAGPAVGVQVGAVPADLLVQHRLRQVVVQPRREHGTRRRRRARPAACMPMP